MTLIYSNTMENQGLLKRSSEVNVNIYSGDDTPGQVNESANEFENLDVSLLEDLDSYMQDINDRLTISRMVSDSVIKGMVNAVEGQAAEKMYAKELEIAGLREMLNCYHHGNKNGSLRSSVMCFESESSIGLMNGGWYRSREYSGNLGEQLQHQLSELEKEIDKIRAYSSARMNKSGFGMAGLGGVLDENASEKWINIDRMLDLLRNTVDSGYKQMDDTVYGHQTFHHEQQQERAFEVEIEDMVIRNCFMSFQEEFEENLWSKLSRFCTEESMIWTRKIKEISNLREELDSLSKSLLVPENGQPMSPEIGDERNSYKWPDHFHFKVSGHHISSSNSLWEGNGKHEESIIPENLDLAQLNHMNKDELVTYFKTEMIKMKRNHESKEQLMTEEYFSLKREFLNFRERGSPMPSRKDREFDVLRKRIPEVIVKLDSLVAQNERLLTFTNGEKFLCVKEQLDAAFSENHQLRGLLMEKKNEIKSLLSKVSDAEEKMSKLNCDIQDVHIKASICEEVNKCLLMEVKDQVTLIAQESNIEHSMMQEFYEVIFREAAKESEPLSKCEMYDLEMKFNIMQELCGAIFMEAVKDTEEKINNLNMKYIDENRIRVSLEMEALEKQKALFLEIAEKERLLKESLLLTRTVEEKEKLMLEAATTLAEEKKRFELASEELNSLKNQVNLQQVVITETSKESDITKASLAEVFEQLQLYKVDLYKTNQNLELAKKKLQEADEEKMMLIVSNLEKQNNLLLAQAKEGEYMKQMGSLISLLDGILNDLECRVAEKIEQNSSRFESLNFHLCSLTEQASEFRRMGFLYKQKFERRCSDLQKAEAEVDLLGDEVDVLLNLLEKIYIALDHYSPVLKHYPGVIEILKMIKRELSGESTKSA